MLAIAIDAILGLVVIEAVGLVLLHRKTGHGPAPRALLGNLAAGFCLMLAVRLALGRAPEALIAGCLFVALIAHVGDLAARWGRAP